MASLFGRVLCVTCYLVVMVTFTLGVVTSKSTTLTSSSSLGLSNVTTAGTLIFNMTTNVTAELDLNITTTQTSQHRPAPVAVEPFSTSKSLTCACGRAPVEDNSIVTRVIGGSLATPLSYPWQAILRYYNKQICSGTVINDRYILTAAHCIFMMRDWQKILEKKYGSQFIQNTTDSIDLEKTSVMLGAYDKTNLTDTEEFNVENYLVHPDHRVDEVHDTNDLALLRLGRRIHFNMRVHPVCLPDPGEQFDGHLGIIVGWGRTQFNGSDSPYLKHAKVHILPDSACVKSKVGSHFSESPDSMVCAYKYKTDACQGDSGGPLLYENTSGAFIQVGIVSWGIECAKVGYPGVYTEVSKYTEWITNNTQDAEFCTH